MAEKGHSPDRFLVLDRKNRVLLAFSFRIVREGKTEILTVPSFGIRDLEVKPPFSAHEVIYVTFIRNHPRYSPTKHHCAVTWDPKKEIKKKGHYHAS